MHALVRLALLGLAAVPGLRAEATVEIRSSRPATIRIGGELAGSAPLTLRSLPPGTHTVTAQVGGLAEVRTFFIQSPAGAHVERFLDLDAEIPTSVLTRPALAAPRVVSLPAPAYCPPPVRVVASCPPPQPSLRQDLVVVPAYAPPPPPVMVAPPRRRSGISDAAGVLLGVGLIAALADRHDDRRPPPAAYAPAPRPPVCAPAPPRPPRPAPRPPVCAPSPPRAHVPAPRPPVYTPAPAPRPGPGWGHGGQPGPGPGRGNGWGPGGRPGQGQGQGQGQGRGNAWGRRPGEGPDRGRGRPLTGAYPGSRGGLVDGGWRDPQRGLDVAMKVGTRKALGLF